MMEVQTARLLQNSINKIQSIIWNCVDHYFYDDAILLAEIYFAEEGTPEALHVLATCYFRAGQVNSAYMLLKKHGPSLAESRFLFAKCCLELDKFAEAEESLTGCTYTNFGAQKVLCDVISSSTVAPFCQNLLAHIHMKTFRKREDVSRQQVDSLRSNPFLWSSYSSALRLGEKIDPNTVFLEKVCDIENMVDVQSAQLVVPVKTATISVQNMDAYTPSSSALGHLPSRLTNARATGSFGFAKPVAETPEMVSNQLPSSSNGRNADKITPAAEPTKPAPTNAPRKNPPRRSTATSSHSTRAQSQPLRQNQPADAVRTRRSPRLVHQQSSVKENTEKDVDKPPIRRNLRPRKSPSTTTTNFITKVASTRNPDVELIKRNNEIVQQRALTTRLAPSIEESASESEEKPEKISEDDNQNAAALSVENYGDNIYLHHLRKLGEIEAALVEYDCPKVLQYVQELPVKLQDLGYILVAAARAYFERQQYALAVETFKKCRERAPHWIRGMEYYSTALWHLHRESELSALAQDLTENFKMSSEAWIASGNCFSLQKERELAIKFFKRAIQIAPDCAYAFTLLGIEYLEQEAYDQAAQSFRNALRVQPRFYNAFYGLGRVYQAQEKMDAALLYYHKALQVHPRNTALMCHVAFVYQSLQKYQEALKIIDCALQIDSRNPMCRYRRACILFAQEKYEEAKLELDKLKETIPGESDVYFLAGKVLKRMNQSHLALMNVTWATDLDPKGGTGRPMVDRFDEEPVAALASLEPDNLALTSAS